METRSGYISGIIDNDTFAYLGIPFAAPPVDEKRWRLPVREESWNGVRAADKFGEPCPQDLSPDNIYGLTSCDENCLYLNVWVHPKKERVVLCRSCSGCTAADIMQVPRLKPYATARTWQKEG